MENPMRNLFLFILISLLNINTLIHAEVVLDGTLGNRSALPGPDYLIAPHLGQQHGSNLFHSFQYFNLQSHESAIFSGPEQINTIIGRVTGGQPSHIDGLLRSTIPKADLYFLNPNGILFGPNARLDLQGSFHASTADYLRFKKGGRFDARQPQNSLLNVAPVEAFGFLTNTPATLSFDKTQLSLQPEKTFSLVSGDINMTGAQLFAPSGQLNLVSVAQKGEVNLSHMDTFAFDQQGLITFSNQTHLNVDGVGAGEVFIRGGQLVMRDSAIQADTLAFQDGKGINIKLTESLDISGDLVAISNDTFGSGNAGQIRISAPHFDLSGSTIDASSLSSGRGGDISITTDQLKLKAGARITSNVFSTGSGGNLFINSSELLSLSGQRAKPFTHHDITFEQQASTLNTSTFNTGQAGQINLITDYLNMDGSHISADSLANEALTTAGNAGHVVLQAKSVSLTAGARITASTLGSGQGGNIQIQVDGPISLEGEGEQVTYSGLLTRTLSQSDSAGCGGNITLTADQLTLKSGATISASTFGAGNGGKIAIKIKGLATITGDDSRGEGSFIGAGAWSDADNAGQGGSIVLEAKDLQIVGGAGIETGTGGPGDGGNTTIKVSGKTELLGKRSGDDRPSRILTASEGRMENAGHAGAIVLETQELYLTDNTTISVLSEGPGQGGNLTIKAQRILAEERSSISASSTHQGDAGNLIIQVEEGIKLLNSDITTASNSADGGNITLIAPTGYFYLNNAETTTSVKAKSGNGGNINLNAQFIILKNGQILSQSFQGNGGKIQIKTSGIYNFEQGEIEEFINAQSSGGGIDGEVKIDSPAINLDEVLVVLSSEFVEETLKRCDERENPSTFKIIPKRKPVPFELNF
ncbi:MAG: hypothetical protein DRR00_04645 [Candidatus Parabeggiatoa sp. nov. 3]|nr:MAG: hypothetical protein DRR00_04645 [Gammaproteobacteria bacterium]